MKKFGLIALIATLVVGCTTAYGPRYEAARGPNDVGYYDTRLDENRYRVQYRTDYRDGAYAEDFVMRRAAELTLDRGYQWFQVINRNRAVSDDMFGRYDNYRYQRQDSRYRGRPDYYDRGYDDDAIAVIEVVMGYNPPPGGASTYDARQVLDYSRGRRY